ncbi:diguanylate cyclase [Paucilactobacillus suebicus]|nr:sensor domain-containing diguanylate cyclase [Paucilactobacillus suebicus]
MSQWIVQSIFTFIVIIGFEAVYLVIWQVAHPSIDRYSNIKVQAARWGMIVTILLMIALSRIMESVYPQLFLLNITTGLLAVTLPLLNVGMILWEYLARVFCIVLWWLVNIPAISTSSLIAIVVLFVAMSLNWHLKDKLSFNFLPRLMFCIYTCIVFWLTSSETVVSVMIQAMLMYFIDCAIIGILLIKVGQGVMHARETAKVASFDTLTNARSYALYTHDVTELFKNCKNEDSEFTLVTLDVDHFKSINDTYGHLAGNEVLVGVATTLRDTLKPYDADKYLYRTGGEEFNIIFPNMNPKQVAPIIKQCWQDVRTKIFEYDKYKINVTISMGMSAMQPADAILDDTYKRADSYLYDSKNSGRDRITSEGQVIQANN